MTMTMTELAEAASRAASAAYAAHRFQVSMAFTNALALAKDALEAENVEYNATLALYSCFSSEEEEQAALEAEREAASSAAWARKAAWSAWEDAQAAFHAEEAAELEEYKARQAAHAASLEEEEEEELEAYRSEGIREFLQDLPQGDREWVCGENQVEDVAHEWAQQGFTALGVRTWIFQARCFCASTARALTVLGLTPEDCRSLVGQGDTVGYHVSNGDMSPAEALLALQA